MDIIRRRIAGESLRAIEKAVDVPRSSISELLKRPEVVAMVEAEQAAAGAVESDRDAAVGRERRRETNKRSSATYRESVKRAELAAAKAESLGRPVPAKGKRAPKEEGKGQRYFRFGWDAEGNSGGSWHGGTDDNLMSESEDEWIARRRDERERTPYPASIVVHYEGNTGPGSFGVDCNDPEDFKHRVSQLAAEGFGNSRDIAATLREVKPGAQIVLRFEQPAPKDSDSARVQTQERSTP